MVSGAKQKLLSLALPFMVAVSALGAKAIPTNAQEDDTLSQNTTDLVVEPESGHTYWYHPKSPETILETWRCPESGLCMSLYSLDTTDRKITELAGMAFGIDKNTVTENHILQYCGYDAWLQNMGEKDRGATSSGPNGKWEGKIVLAYPHETTETEVMGRNPNILDIRLEDQIINPNNNPYRVLFLQVQKKIGPFPVLTENTYFFPVTGSLLPPCQPPSH